MLPFLQRFVGSNVKETADHLLYAEVKKNLETYGFQVLGEYSPAGDEDRWRRRV